MGHLSETVFLPVAFTEHSTGDDLTADAGASNPLQHPLVSFQSEPTFLPQSSGRALVIGLIDHYRFSQECLVRALQSLNPADLITPFTTMEECIAASRVDFDLIIYYIPRSRQNPKILGRDDAEIIRYLITVSAPFSGHFLA